MKEINLPSGNYLFVEKDSEIAIHVSPKVSIEIFNKEYKYLFTTKDITEEQAGSIVDKILYSKGWSKTEHTTEYKNYHGGNSYLWAYESLQSLIQANGLDINKNYLILKK
jgi:hypothetical protein